MARYGTEESSWESNAVLSGDTVGLTEVRKLSEVAVSAMESGENERGGPAPSGGPALVAQRFDERLAPYLPEVGVGGEAALSQMVSAVSSGSVNPADPSCIAHLHAPPLAMAAVADLAASVLNPSLDSWDQAPSTSHLEQRIGRLIADLAFGHEHGDTLMTTGGTESNLVALLLAREHFERIRPGSMRLVCADNAHHSVARAAWILGLSEPVILPTDGRTLQPEALDRALDRIDGPAVVVATAGTTDTGDIDPLREAARTARKHSAWFHVDAAYGGFLLFSERYRDCLEGLHEADSVTMDLHKFGWQPLAAGLLCVSDRRRLRLLDVRADYLNADDDTEAGFPDLLHRSIRTSRRPDVLKVAVTFRALGRSGLGAMVDRCCDNTLEIAEHIRAKMDLPFEPNISTVLFRPSAVRSLSPATADHVVSETRRILLERGRAVIGRATLPAKQSAGTATRTYLKFTVLNPWTDTTRLVPLLDEIEDVASSVSERVRKE
ncbi:amino acid decarboxylase [Nocardiopsis kunsanensis]|uniref:Amino acid decarboxylase n=1 Tax=Nocardiopsis kunsanensis TaxID=141693 RepID=A0A918XM73_9ACTN|nr:amino acid decarboxylase [Nocardiopsis kunsanensis]